MRRLSRDAAAVSRAERAPRVLVGAERYRLIERSRVQGSHEQKQIDRAVRAQKVCERDHRGAAAQTYERQV
jgi:hypothetical protein